MPGWVFGAIGTFAVSLILATWLLRRRGRGIGPPFGRRARPWALLIVAATAAVATAAGLILFAVSGRAAAVYVGVVAAGGLWFSKLPPQRDRDMRPRTMSGLLTLPFSRLYDRMGDDMEAWCDTRLKAASAKPQWIADAIQYYYAQAQRGIKSDKARADLGRWHNSVVHKIGVVRLINLDTTPVRIRATLQSHPSTQDRRKYAYDDPRLADRLESDGVNELRLFLAYVYRLGYHKLLVYPIRPLAFRTPPREAEPTAPEK